MRSKDAKASSAFARSFLAFAIVLTTIGSAFAQGGSTGAISGIVKDENGAGVPGAQIEIINADTGVTVRSVTSDSSGNFGASQLPAGNYKVADLGRSS